MPEKGLLVITSGGDAPGMNPALRSVVRCWCAKSKDHKAYGAIYGYKGLLNGKPVKLDHERVAGLLNKGGTEIGAGRCEGLKEKNSKARRDIRNQFNNLKSINGIERCVVIGGNGSFAGMDSVLLKESGLESIGIPATIDNDIWGTDLSLGVDTALNTAVEIIDKIRDTASAFGRIFVVELMGRDCGYLALAAAIATEAEAVFIPEKKVSFNDLLNLQENLNKMRNENFCDAVIVVAEGSDLKSQTIQNLFEIYTNGDVRKVVPGYTLRGGCPSAIDRILGCRLGYKAANSFEGNNTPTGIRSQIITLNGTKINANANVKDIIKKSGEKAKENDSVYKELAQIQESLSKYHESKAESGALLIIHGQDAPGINAAIRAFVRTALDSKSVTGTERRFKTIAVRDGFKGLSADPNSFQEKNFVVLDWENTIRFIYSGGVPVKLNKKIIEPIRASPVNWLENRKISEAVDNMLENINKFEESVLSNLSIDLMVVIGGQNAIKWIKQIKQVKKFTLPIIFIPASIDNDLRFTDYSIGFDTAVNKAIKAIDNIKETALAEGRVFLIETMGGLSGLLPLSIGLATGAEQIFIPELFLNSETCKTEIYGAIKEAIMKRFSSGKNSIQKTQSIIIFHECIVQALGGLEKITEEINNGMESKCKFEVRKTILGYTLRGGSPSAFDRILATRLGADAAKGIPKILKEKECKDPKKKDCKDLKERNYKDGIAVAIRNNKIERLPILSIDNNNLEERKDLMEELARIHCCLSKDDWLKSKLEKISLFSEDEGYSLTDNPYGLWEKHWEKRREDKDFCPGDTTTPQPHQEKKEDSR